MHRLVSRWPGFVRLPLSVSLAMVLGCTVALWEFSASAQEPRVRTSSQRKVAEPAPVSPRKERAALEAHGRGMSRKLFGVLRERGGGSRTQQYVRQVISDGMKRTAQITAPKDPEALVTQTLLAAMDGMQGDLHAIASKLQNKNDVKAGIREEIAMLEGELSDWPDGEIRTLTYRALAIQRDGRVALTERTQTLTKEEALGLLEKMRTQLDRISGMGEADMLALQDAMNQQARLMQLMSNLMKTWHDMAKAIIRNMR